jgi:hypothetical protein
MFSFGRYVCLLPPSLRWVPWPLLAEALRSPTFTGLTLHPEKTRLLEALRRGTREEAGKEETRHLRLPWPHAHLRTQPEREVHSARANDAQAAPQEPHGDGRMVPEAPTCTGGRAAENPQRQAPRPLPVLRPTDKLSEPSEVLSGRRKDLEEVAKSSHARKPVDVGAICRTPTTSSVAAASDSPWLDVTGESA